jgi:hypothetical protein
MVIFHSFLYVYQRVKIGRLDFLMVIPVSSSFLLATLWQIMVNSHLWLVKLQHIPIVPWVKFGQIPIFTATDTSWFIIICLHV